jgi:hypothetical protein
MPLKDIKKRRQYIREWKKANPEIVKAQNIKDSIAWAKRNKEPVIGYALRRGRALRLGIGIDEYREKLWADHIAAKKIKSEEKLKQRNRDGKKKRSENIRAYITDYKSTHPCQCGYSNPAALAFHHRDPSTKLKSIGKGKFTSLKKLIEEIEKCDIMCANCHLELHDKLRRESLKDT